MSDIIDLQQYLQARTAPAVEPGDVPTFALFGGEGERSRFALPLWRAIYLCSAERGGVVWQEPDGSLTPVVVLDLKHEPARTAFAWQPAFAADVEPPKTTTSPDGHYLAVLLGDRDGRRALLIVAGAEPVGTDQAGREDMVFLAGECAGLLLLHQL